MNKKIGKSYCAKEEKFLNNPDEKELEQLEDRVRELKQRMKDNPRKLKDGDQALHVLANRLVPFVKSKLGEYPLRQIELMGPFGIGCEMTVYITLDISDKRKNNTFALHTRRNFHRNEQREWIAQYKVIDHSKVDSSVQKDSIAWMSGLQYNVTHDIAELTIEKLMKLGRFTRIEPSN